MLDKGVARRQGARSRADDLRHRRALYRPSRPRRRRRYEVAARKPDAASTTSNGSATPRSDRVEQETMHVTELAEDGAVKQTHAAAVQLLHGPAGVPGRRGASRHRGTDQSAWLHPGGTSTSATRPSATSSAVGVCVAIPPIGKTPVPVGVPKTGFHDRVHGDGDGAQHRPGSSPAGRRTPRRHGTPSVSPISATAASPSWRSRRSRRATSTGRRRDAGCTPPKIGFEKYFLRKIRGGTSEPFYEKLALQVLGIDKLKAVHLEDEAT